MSELEDWLSRLRTGNFQARWNAAKVLPQFGAAVLPPLLQWIQEGIDAELLWFVVRILGETPHPQSVAALTQILETGEDEDVCTLAAQALAHWGQDRLEVLTDLLPSPQTRRYALLALAQVQDPRALAVLLAVAQEPEPDPEVRTLILEILSQFRDPQILPILGAALADRSASVRQAAIAALGRLPPTALFDEDHRVAQLSPHLWDIDLEVCQTAALALSRLGTPAARQVLQDCLVAPHTPLALRLTLIQALAYLDVPEVIQQFRVLLSPESQAQIDTQISPLLEAMLQGMAQLQQPESQVQAVHLLLDWLTWPQASLQALKPAMVNTLGQLGRPEALPALIALLAEPDLRLRLHVIAALKQIDSEAAYRQLQQQAAATPPPLRTGIQLALQEW